jgi:hypothetical protein
MPVDVIPDIEFMSARDTALMSPGESHGVEVLVDVELQHLRQLEIGAVEVKIVSEAVQVRNDLVIAVGHALR